MTASANNKIDATLADAVCGLVLSIAFLLVVRA
jgi:hypothetical protein